jgi:arylsulfatase A-like enzyme
MLTDGDFPSSAAAAITDRIMFYLRNIVKHTPWGRLALLLVAALAVQVHAETRPNVVIFLADDLGWRDLGCTGSTFYETPNIDALAARGMMFTNAYAACPVCSPTRAALLTGLYPPRTGVTDWIGAIQPDKAVNDERYRDRLLPAAYSEQLALEETTIAETFKKNGYATFMAGKWHLGREKFYPDKQGFDVAVGASHAGSPGKGGYFSPYNVPLSPGPEGEHLDLRLAAETAKWIGAQSAQKPFFIFYPLYDVHTPLMAPAETVKHFEEKRTRLGLKDEFGDEGKSKVRLTQSHAVYAAMVKTMDDAVGIVVKQLESKGLLDHTIIVFTSDNGGLSTREGSPTSNLPLRGGKGWAYEGGIRVPLIIVAPGLTKPGSTSNVRAISMDIFPTLASVCGFGHPPMDGVNLKPALKGGEILDRALYWHYPHYGNQGGAPFSAILDGKWKLIAFHDPRQGKELYDIQADPSERRNLIKDQPAKVEELTERLAKFKMGVGAKDATPREGATR